MTRGWQTRRGWQARQELVGPAAPPLVRRRAGAPDKDGCRRPGSDQPPSGRARAPGSPCIRAPGSQPWTPRRGGSLLIRSTKSAIW